MIRVGWYYLVLPGVIALALLGAPAHDAWAQDAGNEPALPDIAPRVVEIRGQLEISLPSLQRRPLGGFNPPPRVVTIPSDRRPFTEEYKQESIDLPPSPLNPPQPPSVASLIALSPRSGLLEVSAGRYYSRGVRFRSEWPVSVGSALYSKLDYRGSDGHQPDESRNDVTASFDVLNALVGLEYGGRRVAVGGEVNGFLNGYRLYGAAPGVEAGSLRDDPPERDGHGGGATVSLRTQAATNVDLDAKIRFGTSTYETHALIDGFNGDADAFTRQENVVETQAALDLPLAGGRSMRGDLHFTGLGFDNAAIGQSLWIFDAAGGAHFAVERAVELTALARVMTFSTEDAEAQTYFAPDIRLDFYPAQGARLYVRTAPRADHHTTASLYRESPYLVDEPVVEPTIYTLDARGGGRLLAGAFEADLHVGYSRAPNFLVFERAAPDEANGYAAGFVAAHFEEATISYLGGDVSVNLPAGLNLSAGATIRDGVLTESDEDIPYFGPVVGRGALSYAFDRGRGFVKALTTYESARKVERGDAREIGDYFDLDIEASYDLTESLGVLIRLENLSAGYLQRWEEYDQSPFVIGVGLRAEW